MLEKLKEIEKLIKYHRKNIIIHPEVYNNYKDEFDKIKEKANVYVQEYAPKDKIFLMESECEFDEKLLFKPIL